MQQGRTRSSLSAAFVHHVLAVTSELRGDLRAILAKAQLEESDIANPELRISEQLFDVLWRTAAQSTNDDLFGIVAAKRVTLSNFGVTGLIVSTCTDTGEASRVLQRYGRLIGEAVIPSVELQGNTTIVTWPENRKEYSVLRSRGDGGVFSVLKLWHELTGVTWQPLKVYFAHARPYGVHGYEDQLDCPIHFGAPATKIVLSKDVWYSSFKSPNRLVMDYLSQHADLLLSRVECHATFSNRVRLRLMDVLRKNAYSNGDTLERISRDLRVSARSMQRYLATEGTSFSRIVDDVRRELCNVYLGDPRIAIKSIPALLGYEENTSFYRSCQRWYRTTPAIYRRSLVHGSILPGKMR